MKIEILGGGCPKCIKLSENVEEALEKMGKEAEIVKVTSTTRIGNYGVMLTPALVVNGDVRITGKVSGVEDVISILKEYR